MHLGAALATDKMRGFHRLSSLDKLRMLKHGL